MSFCPSKDIHSIYLDNEMSAEIKAQYEKHLSCCPECQKQLEQMRQVRSVFEKDNLDSSVEKEFLDASFERLQLKMKFSDNVKKTKKSNFVFTNSRWMYAVSGVAAAALFALIIPIRVKASNVNGLNAIDVTRNPTIVPTAISNNGMRNIVNNVSLGSGNGMLISDNIEGSIQYAGNDGVLLRRNIPRDSREKTIANNLLNNVTVVKPAIDDKSISIRITIPGFDSVPVTTEIKVPVNVIAGQN